MLITLCKGPSGEEVGKSERSDEIPVRESKPDEIPKKALSLPQFGMWRSWLAYLVWDQGVLRSSRSIPTKEKADGESAFLRIRKLRRYFFAMFSRISVSAWMFLNL